MLANLILDLLLPATDEAVRVQWVVMAFVWAAILVATRKLSKDYRLLVYGLLTVNLAWFALRAVH